MKKRILFALVTLMTFISANAFEGEIKYRTYTNYSPEMLKLQPLLFNGENTSSVIVKGDKIMFKDERRGTILILSEDNMTEYSQEDNTGYSCPLMGCFTPAIQFSVKEATQTREMLGTSVTKYVCDNNADIGMEFFGWISKDDFGLSQKVREKLNGGFIVPGIALKFTFNSQGQYGYFLCQEIVSIVPRQVDDDEFEIPADTKMDIVIDWNDYKFHNPMLESALQYLGDDMKKTAAFSDLYSEFVKNHPIKPQKIFKNSYELDEDWDF